MRVRYIFSSRRTGTIAGTCAHRKPVPTIIKEVIRISDIVLEILDARFVEKTRNIELENLIRAQGKLLVYIVNKADLVDLRDLREKVEILNLKPYVLFSCKSKIGRGILRERIKIEVKRLKIEKESHKRAQIGIIGYPNTGKSSITNLLSGRKSAGTASESGFTKGIQKIRLYKNVLLLDSPGVIPEKEASSVRTSSLKKHTEIGVRIADKVKNPEFYVAKLMLQYPCAFENYYKIDANGDAEVLMEQIGRKHHFLRKGNQVDTDRTARLILTDWQKGDIRTA